MVQKIIVIDDDPTGNQTVHSCPLLTRWTPEVIREGLDDASSLLFILSNTRSLDASAAAAVMQEICRNLKKVLADGGVTPLFVSRSDSTLRGHYPVETDVIAETLGPFDAHFLIPAFFEGGRVTIDGVHYLRENDTLLRTDQTEFARDSVFGYSTSYLPDYVEEKTNGRLKSNQVARISIRSTVEEYLELLMPLEGNRCVAVDSRSYEDLRVFARALLTAVADGKRFFLRSAASIISALAALPPQPIPPDEMWRLRRGDASGLVVVGSHVQKTTEQLEALLGEPNVVGLELDVNLLPKETTRVVRALSKEVSNACAKGKTPVVFTSRRERGFPSTAERLAFGQAVSDSFIHLIREIPSSTAFLISKGGITSNDVLSGGLEVDIYRVVGQIIPGCTLVTTPAGHRLAELPVVVFPGNVGGPDSLRDVYRLLTKNAEG